MKRNHNNGSSSSLPWWTWVLPFFIANLGTWLSIWFKTDPGASLWYLPTAFGIVMVYWWGPRVLLGVYLNAVVCVSLWDLPTQWSLLYALPETLEVGLSWLLLTKFMGGKYWLPDLKSVGEFLLFGSLIPTFLANAYLVTQLYVLGNILQEVISDDLRILFSADLATQFVFTVPALVLFSRRMREKGWTQTRDIIAEFSLLPDNRRSPGDRIFIFVILAVALISILTFPIHDLWLLYGFLMILMAIRYGVYMAVIGTSWIGLLAFLIPIIITGRLGLSTASYADFLTTNLDILFLCGVTLLTGRAISDLFAEITERKHAEDALRDSEVLHRVTLSNISDAVFITDDGGKFTYICLNVHVIFGYSKAEVAVLGDIGKLLGVDLFDSEELDARTEIQNIERQVSTKTGIHRVLLVNVKRVSIRGGTVLYTCRDITDRQRIEGLLEERQHLLQKILDTEPGTVYIYDLVERRNVYINRYWLLAFGYTADETQAMGDLLLTQIFHPDDLARISTHHENWRQADEGDIREIEYRVRSKAGEWHWLHSHEAAFARDELGKVKQILGISYDITPRKLAQEALRRSEQQLGLIYDTVSDIIFLLSIEPDDRYRFISVNKAFLQATGLNSDQVIGRYADETIPPSSHYLVFGNYRRAIQDKVPVTWEEVSVYPAGQKTAIVTVNAVYNEAGICTHVVGAVHDITERKQMEKAVLKERDFSDAMLNSLPGVFYFYDKGGKFLRWNRNLEIISGYSGEEIARMHPLDFFVGAEKEYIAQRIQEVFENGTSDAEANFVLKNGELIPYYYTGKRIEIENVPYLIGMGIDITRRKHAEEELAKRAEQMRALASHVESVREDERTRIAREIHDEFGQFLTAVKMDLAWVSRRLPAGDEKSERLNQASALVDENVRLVQRIATELRPGLLDDLGLITALDWQANEFSKRTGLLCQLNFPEHDLKLDPSLNTTLFRIFQETLTNVARHAQASRVDVSLQEKDQTLLLSVHDNGRGITETELNDPYSLGLLGLHERVAQWEGKLIIRGEAGRGTTVTVQIPLPPANNGVGL